jgi:putative component of membrane protein insertase Oxa1/YidC/SpoIIIJ protein YidD
VALAGYLADMCTAAKPAKSCRGIHFWPALAILGVLAALVIWDAQAPPARQWLNRAGLAAIAGYQHWARPAVRRVCVCRYHPSCSEYTRQALVERGFWPGAWAGARRILSCRPGRREYQPQATSLVANREQEGVMP